MEKIQILYKDQIIIKFDNVKFRIIIKDNKLKIYKIADRGIDVLKIQPEAANVIVIE